jgi:hypothetical protein
MIRRLAVLLPLLLLLAASAQAETLLLNMGWESDRLYKSNVTVTFTSPDHPVVVTGYRFKLAMIPSDAPFIGSMKSSQVLWYTAMYGLEAMSDNWSKPVYKDATGSKQNLHGGDTFNNHILAVDILKASPWTSAVNDWLHEDALHIVLPAGTTIQMFAGHAGEGPIDFEIQGGLIYQPGDK